MLLVTILLKDIMPGTEVLDDCKCWKVCIFVYLILVIWVAQNI